MQIKRFSKVFLVSLALFATVALIGCGGGGGGGGGGEGGGEVPPPPPPPPPETYTISATGGEGTGTTGGDGGYVEISSYGANDAVVKTSGSVDTSFGDLIISEGIFDFGTNPWTVTSSITVKVYPPGDDSAVSANEYHMHVNTNALNKRNAGNTADVAVTGLHVNSGITLTLALNNSLYGNNGLDRVYISFVNDIRNQGTITVKDLLTGKDEVGSTTRVADGTALDMGDLDLETGGRWINQGTITTKGGDSTTAAGGNGGIFYAFTFTADGYVINTGTVNTSGGNGTSGGNAQLAVLDVYDKIWNTGPIYAKGGEGTDGAGGDGAGIKLYTSAGQAHIYNSGTLDASGGNGTTGGGNGAPNLIEIWPSFDGGGGNIVNSGKLYANGGKATVSGNGGSGGFISLYGDGGNIRTNGVIEAKGGDGIASGGSGGEIDIITKFNIYPAGYIQVSNHLNVNGGKANAGGIGGYIYIYHESSPAAGNIELYGYSMINLNGGTGVTAGGVGGSLYIFSENKNAENYSAVSANGGNASAINSFGGDGGYVDIDAPLLVTSSGIINVNGGIASATGASGGDGGYVYIGYDLNPVYTNVNTNINANGALTNGPGGLIDIEGSTITIQSGRTFSVKGALPSYPGNNGDIFIGGFDVTGFYGTYTAP